MTKLSLDAVAREQHERAAGSSGGRSAETVYGGHERSLRQTVIALTAGSELSEHENPGEATLIVLSGRVADHDALGQVTDLAVVALRRAADHPIRVVRRAAVARHDDPLGLVDGGPGA